MYYLYTKMGKFTNIDDLEDQDHITGKTDLMGYPDGGMPSIPSSGSLHLILTSTTEIYD